METGKPLSKKAEPGQMTLRGSTKPDYITGPICDYCNEGVEVRRNALGRWHIIEDPEGIEGVMRIPCPLPDET